MNQRLSKSEILRRRRDFVRVLFRGTRLKSGPVSIYHASQSAHGHCRRAAFIATGRFPTIVIRNRIRRQLREIYRLNRQYFPTVGDFILRAEPGACALDFWSLRTVVLDLARRLTMSVKE